MFSSLVVFVLAWATAHSKDIDQVIWDAAQNGRSTLSPNEVLVDMDMRYTKEDWEQLMSNVSTHKGLVGDYNWWTNKHVPYVFSNHFSRSQRSTIEAGMREWEKYTCLTFGRRNGEANYLTIQDDNSGCNSYVGMKRWGSQPVNLARYGCLWHHTIVHEFGHAIGFQHEHQRPERDSYVRILLDNVGSDNKFNFNKFPSRSVNNQGVKYDYLSVMHYGSTAFSRNGRYTIQTLNTDAQNVIGRSPGLSFSDIQLANRMYKCNAGCGDVKCGSDGYVGKDCKCWCNNNSWQNRLCECGTEGCGDGGDGGDDGGKGEIECEDTNDQCQEWADRGECTINDMYMLDNCPKACKICGDNQECVDYKSDCPRWEGEGYCTSGEYGDYMARRCRYSCDFCNVTDANCHDVHARCEEWATRGECAANTQYMLYNCPNACRICGDDATCVDFKADCPTWASEGHCTGGEYVDYMSRHCRNSCELCD